MAYRKPVAVGRGEPGTFNGRAFYQALCVQRAARRLTWKQVAAAVGVYPGLFSRLEYGSHPDIDAFGKLCRWMGKPMVIFFFGDPQP